MQLSRYAKAIGGAVGSAVATIAGISFGLEPEVIATQGGAIATGITTLVTAIAVIVSPKNKE